MRRLLGIGLVLLAGCGGALAPAGEVGSSAAHDAVIQTYHEDFAFSVPVACDLYLDQRAIDEPSRTVEYDGKVNGTVQSVVYSLVAGDEHPLHLDVYDGTGAAGFSVLLGEHDLEVTDEDGKPVLTVDGYDSGSRSATTVRATAALDDADGLYLKSCDLAGRPELGAIPAFLRNLASGGLVSGQSNVAEQSSGQAAILPNWDGPTLLDAYSLVAGCLGSSGWSCGCWKGPDGRMKGWCK